MQTENTAADTTTETAQTAGTDTTTTEAAPASATTTEANSTDTSTTAATDDGTEGKQQEGETTDPADRDEQGRFKPKIQKRIDELTHARRAAERETARWRAIAENAQKATPAPQAHEFATDEEYDAAARRHEIREAAREISAENAQEAANQHQQDVAQAVAETYNQRVQAAVARIPDFVDVVGKADIKINNDMLQALQESEHGPDLVYMLAKNPAEATRLASLSTRQLDREIGRMEAAITAKTSAAPAAPPAARTTKAPAPAGVGASAGGAPANTDPSKMTMAEYEVWRAANGSKYVR